MRPRLIAAALWLAAALPAFAAPAGAPAPALDQAVVALCDKRIALLGELPSHGEARGFAGKAVVARALVERCGFDAVLFESGIYEFVALEPAFAQHKATARQLDDAIGKLWWASELSGFRAWLLTQGNKGSLRVGGIDDQVSATSTLSREGLPALVAKYVPDADARGCLATVGRHLAWSYDDKHAFDDAAKRALGRCAGTAAGSAVSAPGDDGHLLANFDALMLRDIGAMAAVDRDAAMQRNLLWHLRRLPADSKVVVWTANVHAAKRSGGLQAKPMGAWLAESHGDALGSLAFTALAGRSSLAGREPKDLPKLGPDSLEAKLLGPGRDEAFAAAPALRDLGMLESRLYGTPDRREWATSFDGVVVYRTEKPASFSPPKP